VERSGIRVDSRLRTSHSHIYAAGDVNGGFQFTHAAGYEGGIVISNAVFRLPRKVNYTWLPWVTYTDPELASIGMNETAAKKAGINCRVITESFKDNDRALAEKQTEGKIKLLLNEKEKPIGVQILGPGAGNLISEWVAAFNGNVKLSTLAAAIHPYPTIGEINKRVAGTYLSPKFFLLQCKKDSSSFSTSREGPVTWMNEPGECCLWNPSLPCPENAYKTDWEDKSSHMITPGIRFYLLPRALH
jgi:hypothetical protein